MQATLGSRALFPDLDAAAYLNHAAISPVSRCVSESVNAVLRDYSQHGSAAFPVWQAKRNRLKEHLAELLCVSAVELALGTSTTRAITDIALCFPWKRGDRVVLFTGEFPANVTPWQQAAELFDLKVVFCSGQRLTQPDPLAELEGVLKQGVALVAVSLVQFQTGFRVPVEQMARLCHDYGAQLFVDGIQGVGVTPLDLGSSGVDYLCCGAHKWLLGVEGAAFLYVRSERAGSLRPYTAGWLSHEEPASFLFQGAGMLRYDKPFRKQADVFEGSTGSLLGLAALGATVPLLVELRPEAIWNHVNGYFDRLEPLLVERGFSSLRAKEQAGRSTSLCMQLPESIPLPKFASSLKQQGVFVGTPDGNVRFAPHFCNSYSEIEGVVAAVDVSLHESRQV